jgi:Trk K+ transport system NAD-binding subunit
MEFDPDDESGSELLELVIPHKSPAITRQIVNIGLPAGTLIILVRKGRDPFVPRGSTVLEENDSLLILTTSDKADQIRQLILLAAVPEHGDMG